MMTLRDEAYLDYSRGVIDYDGLRERLEELNHAEA